MLNPFSQKKKVKGEWSDSSRHTDYVTCRARNTLWAPGIHTHGQGINVACSKTDSRHPTMLQRNIPFQWNIWNSKYICLLFGNTCCNASLTLLPNPTQSWRKIKVHWSYFSVSVALHWCSWYCKLGCTPNRNVTAEMGQIFISNHHQIWVISVDTATANFRLSFEHG